MSFEQLHMAYQVSAQQHDRVNRYIDQMRGSNPKPNPELLGQMLASMLDQTLDYYLVGPATMLELRGGMLRVIKVGAGVMSKAASFLIKRTIGSLNKEQSIQAADYLESTRVIGEDDAGNEISYAAFPLTAQTAKELRLVVDRIKDGHYGSTEKAQLTAVMVQVAEAGVDAFMRGPIQTMGFTGLRAKLADNTEQTIVKSLDRLISDMFPKLTHDQAIAYANYLEETMLPVDVEEIDG